MSVACDGDRWIEIANGNRHYDFLRSIVAASLETQRPFLSEYLIRALNFQAIACLHAANRVEATREGIRARSET